MARKKKLDTSLIRLDKHLLQLLVCAWRYELVWLKKAKKSQMNFEHSKFILLNNNFNLFFNSINLNKNFFDQLNYVGVYCNSMRHFDFNKVLDKNLSNLFNYNTLMFTIQTSRLNVVNQIEQLYNKENVLLLNGKLFNKIVGINFFFSFLRFNLLYNNIKVLSILRLMNFVFIKHLTFILRYQLFFRIGIVVNLLKNNIKQ